MVGQHGIYVYDSVALGKLAQDAGDNPPLTAKEERVLLRGWRESRKNQRIKNRLVEVNMRFALSVAKDWIGRGVGLDDLNSAAMLGLVIAADKFNPKKGFRFITYAVWWVKREIFEAILEAYPVHIPANLWQVMSKVHRWEVAGVLEDQFDGMDKNSYRIAMRAYRASKVKYVQLDSPRWDGPEPNETKHLDCMKDVTDTTERKVLLADARKHIEASFWRLTDREIEFVRLKFGFVDCYPAGLTLEKIAVRNNLTRERVRQIIAGALGKIARHSPLEDFQGGVMDGSLPESLCEGSIYANLV